MNQHWEALEHIMNNMESADSERSNTVNAVKSSSDIIESIAAEVVNEVADGVMRHGVNLYGVSRVDKVCGYYMELSTGVGAVRDTLKRCLK